MGYLFWVILNIGVFLFFIFICFRATKLIREKLGSLSALIFVFGLLSFVVNSKDDYQKSGERYEFNFNKDNSKSLDNKSVAFATLDNNLIFKTQLAVLYSRANDNSLIVPTYGYSTMSGLIAGHRWKASLVSVNAEGAKIEYSVFGTIEWKLLGMVIYTQNKKYTGFIDTSLPQNQDSAQIAF
jgi:hypothetical protein